MSIEWLTAVPGDKHKAQCRYCKVEMSAEISALKKHGRSAKHHKITSLCKSRIITSEFCTCVSQLLRSGQRQ